MTTQVHNDVVRSDFHLVIMDINMLLYNHPLNKVLRFKSIHQLSTIQ